MVAPVEIKVGLYHPFIPLKSENFSQFLNQFFIR